MHWFYFLIFLTILHDTYSRHYTRSRMRIELENQNRDLLPFLQRIREVTIAEKIQPIVTTKKRKTKRRLSKRIAVKRVRSESEEERPVLRNRDDTRLWYEIDGEDLRMDFEVEE